jgi:hypothetical protein
MKKLLIYTSLIAVAGLAATTAFAGNEDRAGQAGANELLINPWARTGGWGGINGATVRGVESMNLNVAGMAWNKGTEIGFSHSEWLSGSDIQIESFGISQKVGESGAMGLTIMSMNLGDIERTTEDQPDGNAGTFTPQFLNIALGYSKEFSNSIRGGLVARIVSESINDVSSQGFVIDAGIQYITGFNEDKDNLKFGIAMRNVGTPMKYEGEGLAFRNDNAATNINVLQQQRTEEYEMPALIAISLAYDFKMVEDHKLTAQANFTSNSFIRDQFGVGLEYSFRKIFSVRGAYTFDKVDKNAITDMRISSLMGPSGGITFQLPLGKADKSIGLDYSYRATETFNGTHTFGVILSL